MALGHGAQALAAARAHGEGFPSSYGGRGPWYALFLMGRVAASCGDAALLREALERLVQVQAGLPEVTPLRLQPLLGLQGHLALARAPPRRGHCTVAARHWNRKKPATCSAWRTSCARGWRRCGWTSATWPRRRPGSAPMLQQAADGPRGALFALPALRELAAAPWAGQLDADGLATLRAWGAAAAAAAAPGSAAATARAALHDPLSARETEVLSLMARGMSNKLIARELDLSPHTVKRHVAHVLDKLDLASRSQAAAWYHAQPPR